MIILHLTNDASKLTPIYVPPAQIKVVHPRALGGTAVIVEGIDDESPWMVKESASDIARLLAAWEYRRNFNSEEIRGGSVISAIGLDLKTKALLPEYALLHLEQVH